MSEPMSEQQFRAFCLDKALAFEIDNDGHDARKLVETAQLFVDFVMPPSSPESTEKDLTGDLSVVEEYAIWLAETGVDESANQDLNEGADPVSERGEEVSDEDWRAAMALAHRIAEWIRTNPGTVLQLTREGIQESETAR